MSEEVQAGLVENEPAGLDSIIDKAIEASEAPNEEQAASEPKADKTGRLHGEGGKFISKNPAAEASKEPADAAKAEVQTKQPDPAQPQPVEAPARWTAEEKAVFATWPPDVQKAVVERQKAMEADYTRKTQEASELRKSAEPYLNAIKPFEQYLAAIGPQVGRAPHDLIKDLLAVEYRMRTGTPEQKYAAFLDIARSYQIDLAALTRGEFPQTNPEIETLRQQVQDQIAWRQQFEHQIQHSLSEQTNLQIDTFANAKDEAGRPKYPHFERVRLIMANDLANGGARTLEEAYQKATQPIQDAIAEELKVRQQHADTQRKEAVARAEKAAPVRSSGSQPGGSAKGKGLDAILDEAISARM